MLSNDNDASACADVIIHSQTLRALLASEGVYV
jgi:hypothetical protein